MLVQLKFDTEKEDVEDLKKLHKWVGDLLVKRGVHVSQPLHQPVVQQPIQQSTPIGQALHQNMAMQGSVQGSVPSSQELKAKQEERKKPSRTAGGCRFVEYDDKVEDMMSSLLCRQRIR